MTGSPVPGQLTATYGVGKAVLGYYGHKMGAMEMPTWKKTSLYAIGAALPYADKIYCALAPSIEALFK
jgi:hypothetical protein